ncbi:hypothetical protein L1887_04833 [Cichorium endivia]|nr:hypothetical protein L1887_04833 [Cichorium endivia]
MANYRLKFSTFIPNSWFYKNKLTKKQQSSPATKPHNQDPPVADQRKSYYFTRDLVGTGKEDSPPPKTRSPDRPRKSTKKRKPPTHKKPVQQRLLLSGELGSAGSCRCRVTPESIWTGSNSSDTEFLSPELSASARESVSCSCYTPSSYDEVYGKVDLPPIITKSVKKEGFGSGKWRIEEGCRSLTVKVVKEDVMGMATTHTRSPVRRFSGGKVKGNCYSPRVGNRVRVHGINGGRRSNDYRRSLSESTAVVKTSVDPGRDFKESMVEMIMENNMKSSKDLEDLLACYLLLNSDKYHDLIIKVFKQIWFESTDIRL